MEKKNRLDRAQHPLMDEMNQLKAQIKVLDRKRDTIMVRLSELEVECSISY